ncbi:MAG: hypothetical protein U5L76_01080 [Patescibacteria group bacterium]|nr:hypothetical protein [Patescibacteria group bacterium]
MKTTAIIMFVLLFACSVSADCLYPPNDGIYTTTDETILGGRASEAWCSGNPGQAGNTINAMSWNGTTLAGQWKVWGMISEGAVETARDIDENGTGWIDYVTDYNEGRFWLDGETFGSGLMDYQGDISYFNVSTRVSYVGGEMIGVTSNILFTGIFDDCGCAIEYAITNAMLVWQTGQPNQPADYPPFLCAANSGEFFDICCIQAKIYCDPISTDDSSWGAIKGLYK